MSQPTPNMIGVVITAASSGSIPNSVQNIHERNAAKIRSAPCATLITSITPKISVNPDASSAYTPPIRRPRITTWMNCVSVRSSESGRGGRARSTAPPSSLLLRPIRLRVHDRVGGRRVLRRDDLLVAVLPLCEQERLLRRTRLVPAEGPEDRLHLVVVEPVGELLLVVDRRGVLGRVGVVLRLVRSEKLLVPRRLRLRVVADGVEDALGVSGADALRVLVREGRRRRLEVLLRAVPDLDERARQVHAVLEAGRPLRDHVRLLRGDRRSDGVEVLRLRRVDLAVDGLDARGLEPLLDALGNGAAERVVRDDVRGSLRLLVVREVLHPVHEQV